MDQASSILCGTLMVENLETKSMSYFVNRPGQLSHLNLCLSTLQVRVSSPRYQACRLGTSYERSALVTSYICRLFFIIRGEGYWSKKYDGKHQEKRKPKSSQIFGVISFSLGIYLSIGSLSQTDDPMLVKKDSGPDKTKLNDSSSQRISSSLVLELESVTLRIRIEVTPLLRT